MRIEKSVGAVVFRREGREIKYLLLHRSFDPFGVAQGHTEQGRRCDPKTGFKEFWGFSRGLVEEGEDEIETVKRELKEETELEDLDFIPGFRESFQFYFRAPARKEGAERRHIRFQGELVKKTAYYYLAETKEKQIKLSEEHDNFAWLAFEETSNRLTHKNSKDLLKKAHGYLTKSGLV